jgi:hypothetical protein
MYLFQEIGMSYDIELFQLREGVSAEEINTFLGSEDFEKYQEELEKMEEEGEDDLPSIPDRFVNTELPREELEKLVGKAYLRAMVAEESLTEEQREFLNSPDAEAPEEWQEELEMLFEWAGSPGVLPLLFSYGGDVNEALKPIAQILEELAPLRIVAFDHQSGQVVDGSHAREMFQASAQQAMDWHSGVLRALQAGEVQFVSLDEDEENEGDDEEDEKK